MCEKPKHFFHFPKFYKCKCRESQDYISRRDESNFQRKVSHENAPCQAALDNVTIAESVAADDSNTNTTAADDGLTGQIGTALYIAPEISQSSRTSYYTQKVDMVARGR